MRIDVRGQHVELQPALGAYAERRIVTALHGFQDRIPTVTVRLVDENGPRRGVDKKCQVTVAVLRARPVVVEQTGDDLYKAIDTAADRTARAVMRAIGRRRAARTVAATHRQAQRTGLASPSPAPPLAG